MKKYTIFIFNLLSLLWMEVIFSLIEFKGIGISKLITIFLFLIPVSLINSIIMKSFKEKGNFISGIIIYSLLGLWFSIHLVFKNTFNVFFQVSLFQLSDQAVSFGKDTIISVLSNIHFLILLFIPLILFIVFHKKINLIRENKYFYIISILSFLLSILIFLIYTNVFLKGTSSYDTIYKSNNNTESIEKLGIIHSSILDMYKTTSVFEEKIEFVNKDKIGEIEVIKRNVIDNIDFDKGNNKTINEYMKNDSPTLQNIHTNEFKGKNLVYVVAESFHTIGVSEELTPTLYKLINTGYKFNNFYVPNNLSTIGGEFQALTGLFADTSILKTWRNGKNYFPNGIATKFKEAGYNTYAYHNNSYAFQDRYKYLKSQGFTNFKACYNGLEKLINCKRWPQSDIEMINKTVTDYIDSDKPFLAYYMTVSGHFSYEYSGNSIATKNKKLVNNLKYSQKVKGYIATQIELDRALELLINKLEEKGKLDDTVIVLFADHYPYGLTEKEIAEVSTYKRDSTVELHHNNLILWNNKVEDKEINKVCMSTDVLPTVYNLFGIEYDSRLFIGKDIFSNSEGIAIMKDRSWVTDKGTYFKSSGKFYKKTDDIPQDYVKQINKIVANRVNISKMIVANNYYNSIKDQLNKKKDN